jgi:hypothetical protein
VRLLPPSSYRLQVEAYYLSLGVLLPTFHKQYYIGLRVDERPRFKWLEPYYTFGDEAYEHWGMDGTRPEPNNRFNPEDCGAATAAQMYGDAWGWSDVNCTRKLVYICKQLREWGGALAGAAACRRLRLQLR